MSGQGGKGRPILALLLAVALLPTSRGGVFINPDTSYYLFQPYTDQEHKTACPSSDPRLCPILQTSFPSVELRQAIGGFNIRAFNTLSPLEISRSAHTAFWLYDYAFDQATQTHTYRTHTGVERATIFFEYTFGRMYLQEDWKTCGPFVVDLEEIEGIMAATAGAQPLKFDVTATFQDMNCFLGKLWFRASDDVKSSEAQMSSNGGLPFIRYTVDDPFGSAQFNGLFLARTIYTFTEVATAPLVVDCPVFEYPVAWTRAQSGVCLTSPAREFPAVESTNENCAVQAISPSTNDTTYLCTRCGHSRSTYYFAMEDNPSNIVLEGLTFNDLSVYYGSVSMAFKMRFNITNGNTPLVLDFFLSAYSVERSTQTYCAAAKMSPCSDLANGCIGQGESCATTPGAAFSGAWVPTSSGTDFTQYGFRIPYEPQNAIMCISGSEECSTCPNPEQVPAATGPDYCPCITGLCFVLNAPIKGHSRVHTSVFGSNEASSTLFWEFYDTGNPSVVLQYGVITAKLSLPSGSGTVWVLSGTMVAAPLTSTTRGRSLNWYMAAPMIVEGTYDESTEILSVTRAASQAESGASLSMSVTATHGNLQLPYRTKAYTTQSQKELTMSGTLRQLNFALNRIQYTPAWPVGFNTQSKSSPARAVSPEKIRITFNKTDMNQGTEDALGIGSLTSFDLPITVVAVNKGPTIVSKNHPLHPDFVAFSMAENTMVPFPGVVIFDNDVDEVFTTEVGSVATPGQCPPAPGVVVHTMTADLKVRHGTLLINVTDSLAFSNLVVRDVQGVLRRIPMPDMNLMRRLMQKEGDVRCGLDDLFLCISIPSGFFFPASRLDRIVWIGAREVTVSGTQACLNSMFDDLFYQTDEDYNNNVPEAGIPLDAIGCPADPDPIPSEEDLFVHLTDNGNTGCTDLPPLETNITINMIVEGVTSPLAIRMPDGLVLNEDTSLSFTSFECPPDKTSVCGAPQMITRDNGDLTVAVRVFELTLAVRHGTLALGAKDGITFVEGSGENDRTMTIEATLCTLNQAIRTLSYVPDPNFNTERYQKVNGTTWQKEKEVLSLSIKQPLGPPGYAEKEITVFAVNDPPTMELIRPDGLISSETPTMTTAMAEVYMCGGDVSCVCPQTAISCIKIEDLDACEGKGIKGLDCWDDTENEGNMRLVIRSSGTNLFFFDSEDLGCNAGASEGDGSCTTEDQKRAILTEDVMRGAMTGASVGISLNAIEIVRPLSQLQRGVLRLWANQKILGAEVVTLKIEDQGSTGSNVVLAAEAVTVMMNVTACQTVEGWRCTGNAGLSIPISRIVQGGTLPGYGIILVGLLFAGIVFLGCLGIFWYGLGSLDPFGSRSKGLAELSDLNKELGAEVTGRAARAKGLEAFGPWSRAVDNRGYAYWYNRITRETTWLDPRISQMGRDPDAGMDEDHAYTPAKSRAGTHGAPTPRRRDQEGEILDAEPRGIVRAMLRRPGDPAGGLYPDLQEDGFQGLLEASDELDADDILGGREFDGDKSLVTNLLMHTSSYMMNRSSKKEEDIEMLAV